MPKLTPITRISIGLVLLTLSILLTANWLGLTPDKQEAFLDARKKVAETVAVQVSKLAERNDRNLIEVILKSLYERNNDIKAMSLRLESGDIIAESGDSEGLWDSSLGKVSTPTRVLVPIYSGSKPWGKVAIHFTPLDEDMFFGYSLNPVLLLLLFIGLSGYALYHLFLKRALSYLDPTAVIPERVKTAMDVLAEGVLILDVKERIVLINRSFAEKTEISQSAILGKKPAVLPWTFTADNNDDSTYPWTKALTESSQQAAVSLSLQTASGKVRNFMVNSTPILDSEGNSLGALATFDDITKLEKQNIKLSTMVERLKISQQEVQSKNQELAVLAAQDSLTGCLNRRSFYEIMEDNLKLTQAGKHTISCIMLDIDFFKKVNDNYGHGIGDEVIKEVAKVLKASLRGGDSVCRYGGEEFCLLLSDTTIPEAQKFAERIRQDIEKLDFSSNPASADLNVTASLGISDSQQGATTPADIINQADYALYGAKESGRNRVMLWNNMVSKENVDTETITDINANVNKTTDNQVVYLPTSKKPVTKRVENYSSSDAQDILTGLPGRNTFIHNINETLNRTLLPAHIAAIFFIDIDNFKRINNALGYDVGDRLLQEKCIRLSNILRNSDKLSSLKDDTDNPDFSRLNGDQFGVLFHDLPSDELIKSIASRIIRALAEPYHIGEHTIYATCSIGIRSIKKDVNCAETLLRDAESAMNGAKHMSGNSFNFYEGKPETETVEILKLENDLRSALSNNELVIYYQPKVDTLTGQIAGVEALLRWRHPTKGLILPKVFLSIAEKTGVIHEIGMWVFQESCKQAKKWKDIGIDNFTVAVNISATQFLRSDFIDHITSTLRENDIEPRLIEIEVTEYTMLHDIDKVTAIITHLRKLGISASLDDFGTGYSSLRFIKQFAIDSLKIDISFISNITTSTDDLAIVSAIVTMAHAMNLKVIAEGVENNEQLEILKELGCDQIQGYIFSRPKSGEEVTDLLHSKYLSADTANVVEHINEPKRQAR